MPDDRELTAMDLAVHASQIIKFAQESTSLSLAELAAAFKVAATTCDELNGMYERAQLQIKLRQWNPGK